MIKIDYQASRATIGIALTLVFVLITAVFSVIGNASSADAALKTKKVQGSVKLALKTATQNSLQANSATLANPTRSATLTLNLNLKNIPQGPHAADLHQGSCPLTFTLNGKDPVDGPFTPGVTLQLGIAQADATGALKKTLTFQVGGTSGIPVNLLSSGKWFFCIHTGDLSQITGTTPAEKFASLQEFLKTQTGPGLVKQIACQALNGKQGVTSLTLKINGVQKPPAVAN
ncbi:MAG TPA: hypothetical protein VGL94_10360 [Ktedonobacteraceae bacterium]|jgi:hypothetical protein